MKLLSSTLFVALAGLAIGLSSCDFLQGSSAAEDGEEIVEIEGAGATFPALLYERWFFEYYQRNPETRVSYQSLGSGAGIEQYLARTVDFGATDAPLDDDERERFQQEQDGEPIQVPMVAGSLVLAYNLPDVDELRLSREAYCGIFLGEITEWNDAAIEETNPDIELPQGNITLAHRADGSGTTFIMVSHLAEVCPDWEDVGTSVSWPTGIGGRGNEGVTALIEQNEGTIGYVEFGYADVNELKMARLENRSGNFIEPSAGAGSIALEGEEVPDDFALTVPDPDGEEAYPIVGLTWLLLYNEYPQAVADRLKTVIEWCLSEEGDEIAEELGYAPLPDEIAQRVLEEIESRIQGT